MPKLPDADLVSISDPSESEECIAIKKTSITLLDLLELEFARAYPHIAIYYK